VIHCKNIMFNSVRYLKHSCCKCFINIIHLNTIQEHKGSYTTSLIRSISFSHWTIIEVLSKVYTV
jgi:hypothetical protein